MEDLKDFALPNELQSLVPVVDYERHTTQLSRFKHKRYEPNPPLIGRSDDLEERNKETKIVMLHLNKNQVQKLKDTVNKTRPAGISCPFSRFEALAGGHIWRCGSKARGHQPMQPTKLNIAVSFRDRMSLPKWYFGNADLKQAACSHSDDW
ncbi:hypothetical protein R6Q59_032303 [Mikania micrantha]